MQVRFIFILTRGSVSTLHLRALSQCNPFRHTLLLKQETDSLIPWVIKKLSFSFKKWVLRRYFKYHSKEDFCAVIWHSIYLSNPQALNRLCAEAIGLRMACRSKDVFLPLAQKGNSLPISFALLIFVKSIFIIALPVRQNTGPFLMLEPAWGCHYWLSLLSSYQASGYNHFLTWSDYSVPPARHTYGR